MDYDTRNDCLVIRGTIPWWYPFLVVAGILVVGYRILVHVVFPVIALVWGATHCSFWILSACILLTQFIWRTTSPNNVSPGGSVSDTVSRPS